MASESDGRIDWTQFSAESDRKYREVRVAGRAFVDLVDHNIIDGCDIELRFISDCARVFGMPLTVGSALDVCCGAGSMTDALRRAGYDATGIELNADAVDLARARFPQCRFMLGDASQIRGQLPARSFDLILIREAHPFSRIDDFEIQNALLWDYFELLKPNGLIVVAHARRGGGMHYRSLDFRRARCAFEDAGFTTAGPIVFFIMKHLGYRPGSRVLTQALSLAGRLLQALLRDRWIEFVFLSKFRSGISVRQD